MPKDKRYYNEYYSDMHDRMAQENRDGSMIREDHSAVANLPQNTIMRAYPKLQNYLPENLDDTIGGVDRQMNVLDGDKRRKNNVPKKV